MDYDEKPKKLGSGLHFTLAAGETLNIKGTDYVLRNLGTVTATLNLCTQEFLRQERRDAFAAKAASDTGMQNALSHQWKPKRTK